MIFLAFLGPNKLSVIERCPFYRGACTERFHCNDYFGRTLGSLSSDVFERRTSTGSEVFSLLTCLDDIKFVFLSFFTVIEAI